MAGRCKCRGVVEAASARSAARVLASAAPRSSAIGLWGESEEDSVGCGGCYYVVARESFDGKSGVLWWVMVCGRWQENVSTRGRVFFSGGIDRDMTRIGYSGEWPIYDETGYAVWVAAREWCSLEVEGPKYDQGRVFGVGGGKEIFSS